MENLFLLGLTNALIATMLTIVVSCVTRMWKQPPLVTLLWTLVLVKLVTPPLVAIPWRFEHSVEGIALPTDVSAKPTGTTAITVPSTHAPTDSLALQKHAVIATHDPTTLQL